MTDQTKCPRCGAEAHADSDIDDETVFFCGSVALNGRTVPFSQSSYCELSELRAKVAAQQELLKEAADALKDLEYVAAEVRKKLNAAT